jgi:hypothetical protein
MVVLLVDEFIFMGDAAFALLWFARRLGKLEGYNL